MALQAFLTAGTCFRKPERMRSWNYIFKHDRGENSTSAYMNQDANLDTLENLNRFLP